MGLLSTLKYYCWGCFFLLTWNVQGQNKTELPKTFSEICFYTIEKTKFEQFLTVQKAIEEEDYRLVYAAIREMRQDLKSFAVEKHNRAFELWYIGNYTDFDAQAGVAKEATLTALQTYENRLRLRQALYYDHRLFLEQYLAFETEPFYQAYWFMSQERYFSRGLVKRVRQQNSEEGYQLFSNSTFYRPFSIFNELAKEEGEAIREYLDVPSGGLDTTTFIPYSYMTLNKSTASYVLQTFDLDDATQDLQLDREVRALKRFLLNVQAGKIYLVARFNNLEIKKMQAIEARKKREALPTSQAETLPSSPPK
ncbi:MAG: hypothetical protein ACRBFS_27100 [Aureispira sp.]